ncbi:hypothetical protein HPB50_016149 [Hyalomma asiaticum]|uniref:Uncharacterized protein n=1 Tax=Hyalomma asiaticum TaxID=266040 RepID=A0ACB7RX73_HYAAI|nr:hypothetical protein HPB50_016149 [Hyalomma asiaticum]
MAAAFSDVEKAVFAWFCEQRASKMPLSGRIPQENMLDFACMLGRDNFKPSPGWVLVFGLTGATYQTSFCSTGSTSCQNVPVLSTWLLSTGTPTEAYQGTVLRMPALVTPTSTPAPPARHVTSVDNSIKGRLRLHTFSEHGGRATGMWPHKPFLYFV